MSALKTVVHYDNSWQVYCDQCFRYIRFESKVGLKYFGEIGVGYLYTRMRFLKMECCTKANQYMLDFPKVLLF